VPCARYHNRMEAPPLPPARERVGPIDAILTRHYPEAACALTHANPLQLLIATILSAQCTDARVNLVTPALFARFRTAQDFATCDITELQQLVKSTGFYKNKAKHIRACCVILVEKYGCEVPPSLDDLVVLPGVGRKTANVVLGNCFDIPGITVDTHVGRLSRRLGLTRHEDPVKVELELMELVPQRDWTAFSHRLILHGRAICFARKPRCEACPVAALCPKVGVATKAKPKAKPKSRQKRNADDTDATD